jgi:hypothetical protein
MGTVRCHCPCRARRATPPAGALASATLAFAPGAVRGEARVYAMIDTYPAAVAMVRFPETVPWHVRASSAAGNVWHAAQRWAGRLGRQLALRVLG